MKEKLKKSFKIFTILLLVSICFRGFIFRTLFKYDDIGTRAEIELTDRIIIEHIETVSSDRNIDLNTIAEIATEITSNFLDFSTNKTSNNPNKLNNTGLANCIGYSALFNSIANYLIREHNLQDEIKSTHRIGQLYLFGINLHQFTKNPFYSDHDFNELINIKSTRTISIDPSVSDYFYINSVSKQNL